jgi:6-pyruvoyl tetrahydropterin synthase/QueD family protein
MSYEISLSFKTSTAHRLFKHEGKCKNLHGHTYEITITLSPKLAYCFLDKQGMVIDFGEVKETFGLWLDQHLDHAVVLWDEDPLAEALGYLCDKENGFIDLHEAGLYTREEIRDRSDREADGEDVIGARINPREKTLLLSFQPTAENLARYIHDEAVRLLPLVAVKSVTVAESETTAATYSSPLLYEHSLRSEPITNPGEQVSCNGDTLPAACALEPYTPNESTAPGREGAV